MLSTIDWVLIALFFVITTLVGIRFSSQAGKSLGEFFLSGRKLPWYIAGFSMVATTFAADTPLYVTEEVGTNGISGNWLWWNFMIGGMLTTFFFAKLWRRANILTDLEVIELRYGGKPAAFLRGFKSIYLGLFMNAVIIAWVNVALATILQVFFGIPQDQVIWYTAAAMVFVAIYSSLSGLWGIAINDFIQFSIAMTGSIVLAILVVNSEKVGGISGLKEKLPEGTMNFFPHIGESASLGKTLSIGFAGFLAYIGVQWWASWYPGAEPGGGGYVAQRMMSAKDEKNSLFATLFFQIAHYCIRSWPWILVGLSVIILYPHLGAGERRFGYVYAMRDFLPPGLKGLLLVTFLAAYMSTISTQLNWGTSYLINDLYKRFIKPEKAFSSIEASEKHYVLAGRIGTGIMMLFALFITTRLDSIKQAWEFIIQGSAGMGLVLILRWYWWRINAWSEIVATVAPLIGFAIGNYGLKLVFPYSFYFTVGFTTLAWLVATYVTAPENPLTLSTFYERVRPSGNWQVVASASNQNNLGRLFLAWIGAILLGYSLLFLIGSVIFGYWIWVLVLSITGLLGFLFLRKEI